jgi:hypothetical protein
MRGFEGSVSGSTAHGPGPFWHVGGDGVHASVTHASLPSSGPGEVQRSRCMPSGHAPASVGSSQRPVLGLPPQQGTTQNCVTPHVAEPHGNGALAGGGGGSQSKLQTPAEVQRAFPPPPPRQSARHLAPGEAHAASGTTDPSQRGSESAASGMMGEAVALVVDEHPPAAAPAVTTTPPPPRARSAERSTVRTRIGGTSCTRHASGRSTFRARRQRPNVISVSRRRREACVNTRSRGPSLRPGPGLLCLGVACIWAG